MNLMVIQNVLEYRSLKVDQNSLSGGISGMTPNNAVFDILFGYG
jgi:hypothetical protein